MAQFVANTFPGPIYPGYATRIAEGQFAISEQSPGFPVTGEWHTTAREPLVLHALHQMSEAYSPMAPAGTKRMAIQLCAP